MVFNQHEQIRLVILLHFVLLQQIEIAVCVCVCVSDCSEQEEKSTEGSGDTAHTEGAVKEEKEETDTARAETEEDKPCPKDELCDELGPLPDNWEMAYTEKGEVYFIE